MSGAYNLGFTTQPNEIQRELLSATGQIPAWLSGVLIRNGPAKFEVDSQPYRHWFDGLAMLHRFTFQESQVFYSNRFLRSGAFEEASAAGKIVRPEFATNPQRSVLGWLWSLFYSKQTDNSCVNVSMIDGAHVAMTETPHRIRFSPSTLETLGPFEYADKLKGQMSTAHPHYDFQRREMINFVTHISRKSNYHIFRIKDGQRRREVLATMSVDEPAYQHSFALTENYIILVEPPLVARPLDLFLRKRPFIENFRWKPERGTRFIVVDRNGRGMQGIYRTDPFFTFHQINAYEEAGEIVLDLAAYEDKSVLDAFYLDRIRDNTSAVPLAKLSRFRISPGGLVSREAVMDLGVELPRINYRACNMRRHRFVFGVSRREKSSGVYDHLVKACLDTGESKTWTEEECFPGEPVLITSPDASAEDEGVVLSVVLDAKEQKSFLLMLDGYSFKELARAVVPQHIPFGFHGQFYHSMPE